MEWNDRLTTLKTLLKSLFLRLNNEHCVHIVTSQGDIGGSRKTNQRENDGSAQEKPSKDVKNEGKYLE